MIHPRKHLIHLPPLNRISCKARIPSIGIARAYDLVNIRRRRVWCRRHGRTIDECHAVFALGIAQEMESGGCAEAACPDDEDVLRGHWRLRDEFCGESDKSSRSAESA